MFERIKSYFRNKWDDLPFVRKYQQAADRMGTFCFGFGFMSTFFFVVLGLMKLLAPIKITGAAFFFVNSVFILPTFIILFLLFMWFEYTLQSRSYVLQREEEERELDRYLTEKTRLGVEQRAKELNASLWRDTAEDLFTI